MVKIKEVFLDNSYTSDPHFWYDVCSDDEGGFDEKDLYETYQAASNAAIDHCNDMILKYTNKRDSIIAERMK